MENNGAIDEVLSYEDKLHVVCSVMGISAEVLLQRVVDRYYSMLVRHAGTFEDAVPSTEGEKNSVIPAASTLSLASEAKKSDHVGTKTPPARLTTEPSHTTAVATLSSALAKGASPAEKEKRTRRWASLPTEELDKMIITALKQKGACSLKELTSGTGYTSTSRLLERAYALKKQGMLEVVKEGRGYLIDIADRQLQ